jgi:hypothetical protein
MTNQASETVRGDEQRIKPVLTLKICENITKKGDNTICAKAGRIVEQPRLESRSVQCLDHAPKVARCSGDAGNEQHRDPLCVVRLEEEDPRAALFKHTKRFPDCSFSRRLVEVRMIEGSDLTGSKLNWVPQRCLGVLQIGHRLPPRRVAASGVRAHNH